MKLSQTEKEIVLRNRAKIKKLQEEQEKIYEHCKEILATRDVNKYLSDFLYNGGELESLDFVS